MPGEIASFRQFMGRILHGWRSISILFGWLLMAGALLLPVSAAQPTPTPAPPGGPQPLKTTNTNALTRVQRPVGKTNAPAIPRPGSVTNAAASKKAATGTNTTSRLSDTFNRAKASSAFYPVLVGAAVVVLGLVLAGRMLSRKKASVPSSIVSKASAKVHKPRAVEATVHECNVLEVGAESKQVWQFETRGRNFVLNREHTALDPEPLPARLVGKSWRSLFYRKLNVAWLPPEHVFLRTIELPKSDFEETLSMVELQLEKLSPLPAAQTVWSIQVLPHTEGNLQTAIVMIVSRNTVEEFLGKLEGQGYLADRLELPLLDQLQTTAITEDGAWIYPEAGGHNTALVAWWYGGVLKNLDLLTLSPEDRAGSLKEQLTQMAWAGEMEGWLSGTPDWHLVADAVVANEWEPLLRQGLEVPIDVSTPPTTRDLAALTARRSAKADPRANLLPPEFAARYRQQFVDRLWMRGLLAVGIVYAIGVAVYMIALNVVDYKTSGVERQVSQMALNYTNVLQLKARWQVLKDRQELKFAALDCWNATAEHLPEGATLESITFSQGKHVRLNGNAPADVFSQLNEFESAMRKHTVHGEPLFDINKGENIDWRVQGSTASWSLGLELKRAEVIQ